MLIHGEEAIWFHILIQGIKGLECLFLNKHTSNIWQNSIGNGLNTDNKIFEKSYINKIPKPLKYCEELFDPNVLVIKKLVKDLGDLTPIVHKERKKKFFLYDDSSIITHTCFTEVNKKILSYGLVSLEYDKPNSIGNGLNTDNKIFEKSYINKIPKPLKYCEELFDPNVLVIKKLVKDLGDLTPIVHKERKKKFFLYDDSSIITHICFTEVNKKFSLTD